MKFTDIDETKSDFFDKLEYFYKDKIKTCVKTTEEVLIYMNEKYGLIYLSESDLAARKIDSYHDVKRETLRFNNLIIYELNRMIESEKKYNYHEKHFGKDYPILIFYDKENDFLDSNCTLLQLEIKIMRGINTNDINSHSSKFKIYLNSLYLLDWSMATHS